MKSVSFTIAKQQNQFRLDKALREQYPDWGRNAIKRILNARQVRVNGKAVWLGSWKVNGGDKIQINNPPQAKEQGPTAFDKHWLIEETANRLVINKPAGLRTHATRAGGKDNLLDLAREAFGDVALAHRLDRDTSGVILLTRPDPALRAYLDDCFQSGNTHKEYLAVVAGKRLPQSGEIKKPLAPDPARKDKMQVVRKGGQHALTEYEVLAETEGKQLVRLRPRTGRMHQLRVHLASVGAPILGDRLYGSVKTSPRLLLHAHRLTLPAAASFAAYTAVAPVGADFAHAAPPEFSECYAN